MAMHSLRTITKPQNIAWNSFEIGSLVQFSTPKNLYSTISIVEQSQNKNKQKKVHENDEIIWKKDYYQGGRTSCLA